MNRKTIRIDSSVSSEQHNKYVQIHATWTDGRNRMDEKKKPKSNHKRVLHLPRFQMHVISNPPDKSITGCYQIDVC